MKKLTCLLTILISFAIMGAANATSVSPYAYVYGVYGNLINGATLEKVVADTPNTAFSLPVGGLPSALSNNNKNAALVTFYSTKTSQKSIKLTLTYTVDTAGGGPQSCVVAVSSSNIYSKSQPLAATLKTPRYGVLFHPIYSTNTKDDDQVTTLNWKVE